MRFRSVLALAILATIIISCSRGPEKLAPVANDIPASRWDSRPESEEWTLATLEALNTDGATLVNMVPADINRYCPGYAEADRTERKAFWVNFVAALARHESTWRPEVSGGGGRWHGLLQIAPATARNYGCAVSSVAGLKDGEQNLSCGVRIMARTVKRDGVISEGMRGVAADWGPFHQAEKRSDIQAWTRSQPYCAG